MSPSTLESATPEGVLVDTASPGRPGLRRLRESWQRFRDEKLMHEMQAGIPGGFLTPPEETAFEVYNRQP